MERPARKGDSLGNDDLHFPGGFPSPKLYKGSQQGWCACWAAIQVLVVDLHQDSSSMTPQTATLVAFSQMSIVVASQPFHSMTHAVQWRCSWLKETASIFELDLSLISHIHPPKISDIPVLSTLPLSLIVDTHNRCRSVSRFPCLLSYQ